MSPSEILCSIQALMTLTISPVDFPPDTAPPIKIPVSFENIILTLSMAEFGIPPGCVSVESPVLITIFMRDIMLCCLTDSRGKINQGKRM